MVTGTTPPQRKSWTELLGPYAEPSRGRSIFQVLNSAVPFALLWFLMLVSLEFSYWIPLFLALPAAGFLVRLFIIQHDCGHGSFFRSRAANNTLGSVLGVLTLTPYAYWRRTHAIHHATSGNLDHRGFGDVTTLTVKGYLSLTRWKRVLYRIYRNPLILFGVGPVYEFILRQRFPFHLPWSWRREWASVLWTNLAILAVVATMWMTIGIQAFLAVQLPITLVAGTAGIWLFYVQHQFEDTYWERDDSWNFHAAGLEGSSYYDLPTILHWFTGNIGVHHIHHLSSRIPNYRLRKCFRENPELQQVTRLSLWGSLKCARLKLWDEERKKLVGFRHLTRSPRRVPAG
ncbi:MAG: fatty acid desaturase [Acidobacteria bacterium]|nr:fatty acid desaturase [Acidobacteriota bacterium]